MRANGVNRKSAAEASGIAEETARRRESVKVSDGTLTNDEKREAVRNHINNHPDDKDHHIAEAISESPRIQSPRS